MDGILESICHHINTMFEVQNDQEKINMVRESYISDISSSVKLVAECVEAKVAGVVKFEREFSNKLNESEGIEFKGNDTLFKSIYLENVKMALEEEEKQHIDDIVMERAFAETLFDYTLLETLNTLRIINVDGEKLRRGLPNFFKNLSESKKEKNNGIKLYAIGINKEVEEVSFEIFHDKTVMAYFLKDNNEVQPAIKVHFVTSIKDVEKNFRDVAQEFKKEFIHSKLASKNPKVKFFFGYHDNKKLRVKL
jgi:hypothetical protein